jgi:DNA-binding protein HU-beta
MKRGLRKADVIDRVAREAGISRPEAARAIDALLSVIERELRHGGEVAFSSFGKFHVSRRAGRRAVNPSTGAAILVPDTDVPRFTAGAALKRAVRG